MDLTEARRQLTNRISMGDRILALAHAIGTDDDVYNARDRYRRWTGVNRDIVRKLFGEAVYAQEYGRAPAVTIGTSVRLPFEAETLRHATRDELTRLRTLWERASFFFDSTAGPEVPAARPDGRSVFVVHGHDDARKHGLARLLETLGLKPVILHEQANRGRSITQKFEDHAKDAGFAVILLTADDVGGARGSASQQARARQNVVFEFGFFIGKLGRERVCVLYEEGVELPSDVHGLLYVPLDARGAWQTEVAKELKAAGVEVDLNRLADGARHGG